MRRAAAATSSARQRGSVFRDEEGTESGFQGVGKTLTRHGLICALYTDRD
jgi:hypothetical protein